MRVSFLKNLSMGGPVGGKFNFSAPRSLKFKALFITESQKSSSTLSRALRCYLNENTQMHGRVTVTISKSSTQIAETYFR